MSVEQVEVTRVAAELSSFAELTNNLLSLLAEQSNSNGGFLALIALLLALLTLLATVHRLRKASLVLAVLLVATTFVFLWPQEGQIIQLTTQTETATQPAVPNSTNQEELRPTFRVTGISCTDVLNVRMQPGLLVEGAIIGTLACNHDGITPLGPTTRIGFSEWWLVEAGQTRGWVNSRYLSRDFENNLTNNFAANAPQSHNPIPSISCAPVLDASLTRDRLNRQCLVSHLATGRNTRTYWTGICDTNGRASGLGVLRTFDVENDAMNLISMFFGEVESGAPLVGYFSLDDKLKPICSQSGALTQITSRNIRQIAKTKAIAGLDQAISLFLGQQNPAVADFYAQYRRQIENLN